MVIGILFILLPPTRTMFNTDIPVIIPLLATGYLLTIYLLLMLAQRTTKGSRYVTDSVVDSYMPYTSTEQQLSKTDEVDRWTLPTKPNTSLGYFPNGKLFKRNAGKLDLTNSDPLNVSASKETINN